VKILAKKFSRREDPTKLNISRIKPCEKIKSKTTEEANILVGATPKINKR